MCGWRSLVRSLGLIILAFLTQPASSQTVVRPKIVLQTVPLTFDVAAWSADDHFLLTASGTTRELIIWDIQKRYIVDRVRLPSAGDNMGAEVLLLHTISISADGRTARIEGTVGRNELGGAKTQGRIYTVDLNRRTVANQIVEGAAARALPNAGQLVLAIGVLTSNEPEPNMSIAQAIAAMPALPRSNTGRYTLQRNQFGFDLFEDGKPVPLDVRPARRMIDHAALAPDGRRVALMHEANNDGQTVIEIFDTLTARYSKSAVLEGDYETLVWLNNTEFYVSSNESYYTQADPEDIDGPPPSLQVVDATTGKLKHEIEPRCFPTSIGDGLLIGAGLANCRVNAGNDRALAVLDLGVRNWVPIPDLGLKRNESIQLIAAHQASGRLALATKRADETSAIYVVDTRDGGLDVARELPKDYVITQLQFSRDGKQIFLGASGMVAAWNLATDAFVDISAVALLPSFFASDGRNLMVGGPADDGILRADMATGQARAPLDLSNSIGGGFLANRPLFWSVSALGVLKLWETRSWQPVLTTYFFDQSKFLAVAEDGRYDTNLGPDSNQFRWLVSDAPFQSLPPQTFMRDYFEPRLSQRLTDCTIARNCATALKVLPPIAELNRALPVARILEVKPDEEAGMVEVHFELREGELNGKRSGIYNPRLFLNNRFVSHFPDEPFEGTDTIEKWRKVYKVTGEQFEGANHFYFHEKIPTLGSDQLTFSVYAFNVDRVKGDTTTFTYVRPPMPKRKPRAFVLNIGIDAYDEEHLELSYAVADARLLAGRLAQIPGYEMRHAMLAGTKAADGRRQPITREIINSALGILAGFDPGPKIKELAALGVDASQLDNATPDDIVIISFSGHGWADDKGDFYLVPTDAKWIQGELQPQIDSLVSSTDLTMWLRAIKAGEIAFIIDACHSGASVDSGNFKPGPMGDSGLGQLAFDKGIRILAATQAQAKARESSALQQGLLTAALGKGLTPGGGPADLDADRRITLDEWLRYAVQELPRLSLAQPQGASRAFVLSQPAAGTEAKPAAQEPALFDFTDAPSPVILRSSK